MTARLTPADRPAPLGIPFELPLVCLLGRRSRDGRRLGALIVPPLPIGFRCGPDHARAMTVGDVETITIAGDVVSATGHYDASRAGIRAAQLAASGEVSECSIDFRSVAEIDIAEAELTAITQVPVGAFGGRVEVDQDALDRALGVVQIPSARLGVSAMSARL